MKLNLKFLFLFFSTAFFFNEAHAQCDVAGTCSKINNGAYADINKHGQGCKRVTNNTGATLMVPHNTSGEWTTFISTHPGSVTVANCPGGSYSYAGFTYYLGTYGQSCDTVCSGYGSCNIRGTQRIGSSGNATDCTNVLNGLSADGSGGAGDVNAAPYGCNVIYDATYSTYTRYRYYNYATDCATGTGTSQRACACGATSCGGYSYGGQCFYLGNAGESCDTVCASRGGCSADGTRYAGSNGNATICSNILTALVSTTSGDSNSTSSPYRFMGCVAQYDAGYSTWYGYRFYNQATTCASAQSPYQRVCACFN